MKAYTTFMEASTTLMGFFPSFHGSEGTLSMEVVEASSEDSTTFHNKANDAPGP